MTDPFSILTGAIAILGAALRTCQVTEDFIKGIKGAPEAVAKLYGDVTSLLQVLKTLEALLNKRESLQNAALLKFLPNLRLPLDHCMKALADVDCALKPYVKTLGSKGGSKWRVSSTAFLFKYREKDIESLQRGLLSTQSMLDSAVQVVHLSTSTEEFQNIKRLIREERDAEVASVVNTDFDGSTAIHSDYGFAMKRWLRDTTTFTPPSLPLPAVDEDLGMLDTGDVFYKTIVSPAALAALGYDYHDDPESDSRVQVTKRLDKTEVAALIAKTLEMSQNMKRKVSSGSFQSLDKLHQPPSEPPPNHQDNTQLLRKTTVSQQALINSGYEFEELPKYWRVPNMSASEVRELRVQSGTSTLPSSKQNTTPSQVRRSFDVSPDVSPDTEIKNLSFRKLVRGFFGN